MKYIKYICASVSMICAAGGAAQNLNESLTVEGKYTPEVTAADRLSAPPSVIAIPAPQSHLDYDLSGIAANFTPDALSMPATAWSATKMYDTSRGYISLRLGSWLNSSLSAGYAVIQNATTRLNVRLQHNSTSLWQAWKEESLPDGNTIRAAANRFRYDETIGADLRHRITGAGSISAELQYHLSYFNYYGSASGYKDYHSDSDHSKTKAPTQAINDIHARAAWEGENGSPLSYRIEADVRYFGYRSAYILPATGEVSMHERPGQRETAVNAGGKLDYKFSKGNSLGIDITYTGIFNNNKEYHMDEDLNVNRLRIVPAYEYNRDNMSLRIGAELAVVSAFDTKFRVAPDVRFSLRNGITAFSATIGGGTHLRTLAWMHEMDYYSSPLYVCDHAAYSPIDARVALQLNPGGRWTLGLEGLWRTTLDETLGGTYQAYLNFIRLPYSAATYSSIYGQTRIQGFSLGVNAGYEFCRYFGLKGRANWQPQHGKRGILNGFDRPAVTATLSALSHPTEALSISLDYNLRAKRYLVNGNISRLNLSADYRITERLSAGVEFCNLLNRHEMLLPDLPSEGLTVNAGVQLTF